MAQTKGKRTHQCLHNWLVSHIPSSMSPSYSDSSSHVSGVEEDSEHREIRPGTQADFQYHRLPVQSQRGQGQSHPKMLADHKLENPETDLKPCLSGQITYVPDRPCNSYRKARST